MGFQTMKLLPLNDSKEAELKNNYSEMGLAITDEISMVSSELFYQVHKRLHEVFIPGQDILFGGKSVLVYGDLCRLSPNPGKPVFTFNETETMEGFVSMDLWKKFRLAELGQVMHQDHDMFVNLLNKIQLDEIDQNVEQHVIKSGFIGKYDPRYPYNFCGRRPS